MLNLQEILQPTIDKIDNIIKKEHPIILANMAERLFDKKGAFNGRAKWSANTPYTIAKKGSNKPNIDSGNLKKQMTTLGFLENENWFDALTPPPKKDKRTKTGFAKTQPTDNNGYKAADNMRKFSDIGRTDQDEIYIEKQIKKILKAQLNG